MLAIANNKDKDKNAKKKPKTRVWFYAAGCKYEVILSRANKLGWKLITDEKNESACNIFWIDVATIHERFRVVQPWQVVNHFPGMPNIARKNRMGQNLNRMQKLLPLEYNFYPKTWVLPGEFADFEKQFDSQGNSNKIFIIKPDTGCQGRGIFLTKRLDTVPRNENVVAQVYIKKPMLIDDFKFDLRIYCYVSSVRPLRIYLFHDGLVRMCTEKYVKPNKQNLDMSCMHLTNYAVNKNNSNFNQPSAAESSDSANQEDAHKRSLVWFMQMVRTKYGHAKADWLWKRIGILCVRTILCIAPTLSRDYVQHFKSFTNIPMNLDVFLNPKSKTPSTPKGNGGSTKRGASSAQSSGDEAESRGEEDESDTEEDEKPSISIDASHDVHAGPDNGLKFRGSRCFEILGFDIMLDEKLKPWLIEVNHLPSFGTDSPLDLDIKSRLMEQVFSTLPVRSDDELAYQLYHQAESEKRLRGDAAARKPREQAGAGDPSLTHRSRSLDRPNEKDAKDSSRGRPPLSSENEAAKLEEKERREAKDREYLLAAEASVGDALNAAAEAATAAVFGRVDMPFITFSCGCDAFGQFSIVTSTVLPKDSALSQRIQEIYDILTGIYQERCIEKVSKIDRLLNKYQGREEEFLHFVVDKYSVSEASLSKIIRGVIEKYHPITIPKRRSEEEEERARKKIVPKPPDNKGKSNAGSSGKRGARSLSPTNQSTARALWRSFGTPEENEAYEKDVIGLHVPVEEDEWLQYETKLLTQFTRIFPILPETEGTKFGSNAGITEEEAAELEAKEEAEEEENDKDDDEKDSKGLGVINAPKSTVKINSFLDILVLVFMQDRKQTMRLHCPLPGRARASDNDSLPPLEPFRTGSTSSLNIKPGPGWRPPPVKAEKSLAKIPTASQVEVAKRLTQGMSSIANVSTRHKSVLAHAEYSYVQDYDDPNINMGGLIAGIPGLLVDGLQPKIAKMMEDSKMARLKLEQAKSTAAAVLRQQVFSFDPNLVGSGGQNVPSGIGFGNTPNGSTHHLQFGFTGLEENFARPGRSMSVNGVWKNQRGEEISKDDVKNHLPGWF